MARVNKKNCQKYDNHIRFVKNVTNVIKNSSLLSCSGVSSISSNIKPYCYFLAENGGIVGSCAELSCYFGAVCTERTGGALCECAAAPCPDTDTNMLVSLIFIVCSSLISKDLRGLQADYWQEVAQD